VGSIFGEAHEVSIRINGQQEYLWRAVDQDGAVIDILVQPHPDQRAAERFFRRLLRGQGQEPFRIITDRLTTRPPCERSCATWLTPRNVMPTIVPKPRINQPAKGSGICADSSLQSKPSGFSPSMPSSRIFFELDAIC
jgi:hypothetical protein